MLASGILLGLGQTACFGLAVPGSGLQFRGRWGAPWFEIALKGVSARLCASGSID